MNSAATSAASHSQTARTHAARTSRALLANPATQSESADSADTPDFSTLLREGHSPGAKATTAPESARTPTSSKRTSAADLAHTPQEQVNPPPFAQPQTSQPPPPQPPTSEAQASQVQGSTDPTHPVPPNSAQLNPQDAPSPQGLTDSSGRPATPSALTPANDVAQNPTTLGPAAAKGTTALPPQSPVSAPALTGLPIEADADGDVTPDTLAADQAAAGQAPTSSPGTATSASTPSASASPKSTKSSESPANHLATLSGPKVDVQAAHTELASAVAAVATGDPGAGGGKNSGPADQNGGSPPDGSAAAAGLAPDPAEQTPDPSGALFQPQIAPQAPTPAASTTATPQTVNALAAQIVQKLDGASTRFQLTLNPEGLGKVDVAIEITAKGAISATLSFQHAESTAALSSHADALRQALADAGLNLNAEDLSFQTASGGASDNGGQFEQASQGQTGNPNAGLAAMSRASNAVEAAPAAAWTASRSAGLNILI